LTHVYVVHSEVTSWSAVLVVVCAQTGAEPTLCVLNGDVDGVEFRCQCCSWCRDNGSC